RRAERWRRSRHATCSRASQVSRCRRDSTTRSWARDVLACRGTGETSSKESIEMKYATRMGRLGTETAFEVLARARALEAQGRNIVHLEIGEPDFTTPEHIIEAGVKALREGHTHYTPAP